MRLLNNFMLIKIQASEVPIFMWVILAVVLLTQSILIYKDAEKRGENKWLWGFFGLLNVPSNGIVYWVVTRKAWRRIWPWKK